MRRHFPQFTCLFLKSKAETLSACQAHDWTFSLQEAGPLFGMGKFHSLKQRHQPGRGLAHDSVRFIVPSHLAMFSGRKGHRPQKN
jgi:hypothetical protein